MKSVSDSDVVWSEEIFVTYLADPKKCLQKTVDDKKTKSKMSYKSKNEKDGSNVWADLVSVGPS